MSEAFVSVDLDDILVGEELPTNLYLYIDFRFITFRAKGDVVDRAAYDRLFFKHVKNLFIVEQDRQGFTAWAKARKKEVLPPLPPEARGFKKVREEVHRRTMDIFQANHPDKIVNQTITASRKLVTEVMKFPYARQTLAQLQTYSKGTVDHSVNISVLSVYLAMQMGYTHNLILQHVGMGGLLHDIGKPKIDVMDDDTPAQIEAKMREHPTIGLLMLEQATRIPNEVKLIVAQHHEHNDGSGFPKKLRGSAIYDLTRIVSIANVFDELVANGKGQLLDRQRNAVTQLDQVLYRQFDPQKLDKALRILKLGV
jgi:putative nucleotidyltransferase with HDIG domain